jgi:hypothetical protein
MVDVCGVGGLCVGYGMAKIMLWAQVIKDV